MMIKASPGISHPGSLRNRSLKNRETGWTKIPSFMHWSESISRLILHQTQCLLLLLARPTEKSTIEYLVHIGKILSGGVVNVGNGDDQDVEKGEILDSIINILGMTEEELTANTSRSALSTARQVIGQKYPGDDVVYADVKREHIQAVVRRYLSFLSHEWSFFTLEYAWLMHPSEKVTNDFSRISKAMGNVFASRAFSKKTRNTLKPPREPAAAAGSCSWNSIDDNSTRPTKTQSWSSWLKLNRLLSADFLLNKQLDLA